MASMRVKVNDKAVERAIANSPGIKRALKQKGDYHAAVANALGAGYRTGRWHDHKTGEVKGGKAPEYAATMGDKGDICLVHPVNYAAMKDNYLHNTLLKAKG